MAVHESPIILFSLIAIIIIVIILAFFVWGGLSLSDIAEGSAYLGLFNSLFSSPDKSQFQLLH